MLKENEFYSKELIKIVEEQKEVIQSLENDKDKKKYNYINYIPGNINMTNNERYNNIDNNQLNDEGSNININEQNNNNVILPNIYNNNEEINQNNENNSSKNQEEDKNNIDNELGLSSNEEKNKNKIDEFKNLVDDLFNNVSD